jgi:dienelactone hydrolase
LLTDGSTTTITRNIELLTGGAMKLIRRVRSLGLLFLLLALPETWAALIEETMPLKVELKTAKGEAVNRVTQVRVFRDDARPLSPFLIVHHGRVVSREAREKLGPVRYPEVSKYFVEKGFAVFVLTRLGYGDTAEDDVEETGTDCDHRDYRATFSPGIGQATTLLEQVRRQPYVEKDRGLILGNSFGGMIALGSVGANPPGVLGVINFSGGSGGDPKRPAQVCNLAALEAVFEHLGKTSKIPSIWLYSLNDPYWGPTLPLEWAKRYRHGGANVEFVQLPAHGENGHAIFTAGMTEWRPALENFIQRLGLTSTTR